MKIRSPQWVRMSGFKLVVLWGAIVAIGWTARLPQASDAELVSMAKRFRFERLVFPRLSSAARNHRDVNPKLHNISGWISAVGAGIALSDLDGDGLSNDACLVDPRSDEATVTPVPGTGDRYPPFALHPDPLPYDSASMAPMGCLFVDLNEDGLTDIVVYYWGRTPVAFLRRQTASPNQVAAGSYVPQELVSGGARWYTNAGLAADLDGDGHVDLIFGNYFPDGSMVL
ncbi:MAG TPA: VCBS repeat-containing protein, partial [Candidatus Angelobacter sp.]|nr:VCBS repeat-containing protein [Candidatus Angelobacter sp.]